MSGEPLQILWFDKARESGNLRSVADIISKIWRC